jgi:hypothetical protein
MSIRRPPESHGYAASPFCGAARRRQGLGGFARAFVAALFCSPVDAPVHLTFTVVRLQSKYRSVLVGVATETALVGLINCTGALALVLAAAPNPSSDIGERAGAATWPCSLLAADGGRVVLARAGRCSVGSGRSRFGIRGTGRVFAFWHYSRSRGRAGRNPS